MFDPKLNPKNINGYSLTKKDRRKVCWWVSLFCIAYICFIAASDYVFGYSFIDNNTFFITLYFVSIAAPIVSFFVEGNPHTRITGAASIMSIVLVFLILGHLPY